MADTSSTDPTQQFRRATDAFRQAGQQATENGNRISLKLLEQAEANTREVFSAMRRIAEAGDITEVMRLQGDFVRQQAERASGQARELGDLIANFGQAGINAAGNMTAGGNADKDGGQQG